MKKKQTLNFGDIVTNRFSKQEKIIVNDKQEALLPPGFGTKDFIPPSPQGETEQERNRRLIEQLQEQAVDGIEPLPLAGIEFKKEEDKK